MAMLAIHDSESHLGLVGQLHAGIVPVLLPHQFVGPAREVFEGPDELPHEASVPIVQHVSRGRVRMPQLLLAAQAFGVGGARRAVPIKVPIEMSIVLMQRPLETRGGAWRLVVSRQRLGVAPTAGRMGQPSVDVGAALHRLLQALFEVDRRPGTMVVSEVSGVIPLRLRRVAGLRGRCYGPSITSIATWATAHLR